MGETATEDQRAIIYQSSTDLLKSYSDYQSDVFDNFNNRAMDIIRFNQLIIGAIVTAFALFQELQVTVFLIATLLSFLVSLWYCILVYVPEKRRAGVIPDEQTVKKTVDIEDHYEKVIATYNGNIRNNKELFEKKAQRLIRGLWSAFAGILFFVIAILRSMIGTPPQLIQPLPVPVVIDFVLIGGVLLLTAVGWRSVSGDD
ncbi:hypothetical protein AB7C87_20275 [Natrarchaeobius sp. A-rgal3]|uniref:hypothetical protein n=1 Tax=Natrarchaeobius versutus TaxID=1679078 RepID=UPI00350FEED9